MIDIFHRLKPGVAVSDDSLLINYQNEFKNNKDRESNATLLMFKFNYYRCKRDTKKISDLHSQFPKWKSPIRILKQR
jgi:hypothetical protein